MFSSCGSAPRRQTARLWLRLCARSSLLLSSREARVYLGLNFFPLNLFPIRVEVPFRCVFAATRAPFAEGMHHHGATRVIFLPVHVGQLALALRAPDVHPSRSQWFKADPLQLLAHGLAFRPFLLGWRPPFTARQHAPLTL